MRIIDKNTDFYDYLQNIYRDNTFTFDRRDSFIVTKQIMLNLLNRYHYYHRTNYYYLLLQVCNTFWLFRANITSIADNDKALDYNVEFITSWKNYKKSRCLIKFDIIELDWFCSDSKKPDYLINAINSEHYNIHNRINKYVIHNGDGSQTEKHIPILTACGVANYINPLDIYLAFEEYFSAEKTSSERTETVGLTDKEKISNHGFDTKISFRGK